MSDLEDPSTIEQTVGARRHPTEHIGRADTDTQRVTILHSAACVAGTPDLRDCPFSKALDQGIDYRHWRLFTDRPLRVFLAPPSQAAYLEGRTLMPDPRGSAVIHPLTQTGDPS